MQRNLVREERAGHASGVRARRQTFEFQVARIEHVHVCMCSPICVYMCERCIHAWEFPRTLKVSGHLDPVSTWFPDYPLAYNFQVAHLPRIQRMSRIIV